MKGVKVILEIAIHASTDFDARCNKKEANTTNTPLKNVSGNKADKISTAGDSHDEEDKTCDNRTDCIGCNRCCNYGFRIFFPDFGQDNKSHLVKEWNNLYL